ncbi:MAG: hypothetical protein ACYC0M_09680 [Burkholderiales bacterium]
MKKTDEEKTRLSNRPIQTTFKTPLTASYEAWRLRIIRACRTDVQQPARQAWHSLYGTPGFSGARSQVGKLVALFRAEWRRNKGDTSLFFPKARLGYIQRLKNDSRPLSVVMKVDSNH